MTQHILTPMRRSLLDVSAVVASPCARVIIGLTFMVSGFSKIRYPFRFLESVYGFDLVPLQIGKLVAVILPWTELLIGLCLLVGICVGGAFLLSAALLSVFVFAQISAIQRALPISCGCFGSLFSTGVVDYADVSRTTVLLAIAGTGYFAHARKPASISLRARNKLDHLGYQSMTIVIGLLLLGLPSSARGQAPATQPTSVPANAGDVDSVYALPSDPLALDLPASIKDAAKTWMDIVLKGQQPSTATTSRLEKEMESAELGIPTSIDLYQGLSFVSNSEATYPFACVILKKAEAQFAKQALEKTALDASAASLWKLHDVFWAKQDRKRDLQLVEMLLPWEDFGSGHSQWAHYVHAELLFLSDRNSQAYEAYKAAVEERVAAYEPSIGLRRGLDWELGITAFAAGLYPEASNHFLTVAKDPRNVYARKSSANACIALKLAGNESEAMLQLKRHVQAYSLDAAEATSLLREVKAATSTTKPVNR